jgi:putative endonuclease
VPWHYVYILRCADNTLYTGYALDPVARAAQHNAGRGAKYTRPRRPVTIVYTHRFRAVGDALRREYAVKQLSREEKETLIARKVRSKLRTR